MSAGVVQFIQGSTGLKFALSSVQNGSDTDLHMHLIVPQKFGWGAVAIGDMMAGATMFVVYPSASGTGATLSVRTATGHFEPSPFAGPDCTPVSMATTDSLIDAAFICYGLGSDSQLTANPSQSSWLYATGPGVQIDSNSVDATISQHSSYGTFQLNMLEAVAKPVQSSSTSLSPSSSLSAALSSSTSASYTGTTTGMASVTTSSSTSIPTSFMATSSALFPAITGSSSIGSTGGAVVTSPAQGLVTAHAILLGGSFLVLFPIGVFLLRLRSVRLHWITQLLASIASLCGLIIAITMCATTTEYSSFNQGHQILGILTVALLVPQILLGWRGHAVFKTTRRQTWMSAVHLNLGRIALLLGMVTGVLGFSLDGDSAGAVAYGVVAAVVVVALVALMFWDRRERRSRVRGDMQGMEMLNEVKNDHSKIKVMRTVEQDLDSLIDQLNGS